MDNKPAQKTVVKFFLKGGTIVDWPVPEGEAFSLQIMVTSIRALGFFSTNDVYIPHSEITAIGVGGMAAVVMTPRSVHPAPTTKQ